LKENQEIQEWARRLGCDAYEASYPLQALVDDRAGDCLGFLQVFADKSPPINASEELQWLSQGLASTILQTREQRKLRALSRLLPPLELTVPLEGLLEKAVEALREVCHAELCMAFVQVSNLGFRTAAASAPLRRHFNGFEATQGSLIALIADRKQIVRMRDFANVEERLRLFGAEDYDARLLREITADLPSRKVRSWLVAPVVVASQSIAVVVLVNKLPDAHLAEAFTKTDEGVIRVVCDFLAGLIPSYQLYDAVDRLSGILFSNSLEEASAELFAFVSQLIPGIAAVALIRRRRDSLETEIQHLGGEKGWLVAASFPQRPNPGVEAFDVAGEARYFYIREVPYLEGETCLLAVGLKRAFLSEYEKKLLSFLCKELSHILRTSHAVDRLLENFIEMRHAVRSGLTGVVGYIQEALGCYQIYRGLEYQPSVLSQARFRKSLLRAALFANKTHQLLDQSRFLLGQIQRNSLRIGGTSISGLVREVVDGLRIAADDRHIKINYNNKVPVAFDRVSIDRQFIEMLVFNLVDNAIKYSHRNRTVSIELVGTMKAWRLMVTDYGVHIRESDRDAIFQIFTRRPTGQAATTRPGTGLGLTVGKAVVEAHSGKISVESTPLGEGVARTTFSVRIPRFLTKEEGR